MAHTSEPLTDAQIKVYEDYYTDLEQYEKVYCKDRYETYDIIKQKKHDYLMEYCGEEGVSPQCPYIDQYYCIICGEGIKCFDDYIIEKLIPKLYELKFTMRMIIMLSDYTMGVMDSVFDIPDPESVRLTDAHSELTSDFVPDEKDPFRTIPQGYMTSCFYTRICRLIDLGLIPVDQDGELLIDSHDTKPAKMVA